MLGNANEFPLLSLNGKITMPKTSYQISLKGYVGGYDFDRSTVDKELAKNEGKQVNVLIDSLGGSLPTNEALDRGCVDEIIDLDDEPAPKLAARYRERPPQSARHGGRRIATI